MQRRKFVIGAGALFAGASTAIGTGAFSQAELNRRVRINGAASDSGATVILAPPGTDDGDIQIGDPNGNYPNADYLGEESDGSVYFRFFANPASGNPFNVNSAFWVDNVLGVAIPKANDMPKGAYSGGPYNVTVKSNIPGFVPYLGDNRNPNDDGNASEETVELDNEEYAIFGFKVNGSQLPTSPTDFNNGVTVIVEDINQAQDGSGVDTGSA